MSFKFPYLSLDIETTGLDREKSHVLQLAAVYDNGKPLDELPTFNKVIRWPVISHGEEYAMNLNRHLLERAFKKQDVVSIEEARVAFQSWLSGLGTKFWPAGKNVQGFDLPILKNSVNNFDGRYFYHRCLDPGSMYAEDFNHIPTLDEINKITGRAEVSHDALSEGLDVVYAIRHKWGVS
jgi:hypothetical protein